ncbi:hypothetical protein GCM10018773_02670 [Streptomyces candidus]|nr:hypothetical protein GCM10018773_02670 [Streptomyces candidus]
MTDPPLGVSTSTGPLAALPTRVTIVSFIAVPVRVRPRDASLAPHPPPFRLVPPMLAGSRLPCRGLWTDGRLWKTASPSQAPPVDGRPAVENRVTLPGPTRGPITGARATHAPPP